MGKNILVTGAAGFIASKTCEVLLRGGHSVLGVDNLNDYYDPALKRYRLGKLKKHKRFRFEKADIENLPRLKGLFKKFRPSAVVNLAARAGVRYSLENPFVYLSTNTLGTLNLLELCRDFKVSKFALASTSSLYADEPMPFKESLPVNRPISPYAASKKGAEAMCYAYHYLYGLDVTVFRYFTVYGPAGRPDMSYFRFIRWIDEGKPIIVYGDGTQRRDFTYVDDIAEGTVKGLRKLGFKTINLGGSRPYPLTHLIGLIERELGKKAKIKKLPFHNADMKATYADISTARKTLAWEPRVNLEEGIRRTVAWYKENKIWLRKIRLDASL